MVINKKFHKIFAKERVQIHLFKNFYMTGFLLVWKN